MGHSAPVKLVYSLKKKLMKSSDDESSGKLEQSYITDDRVNWYSRLGKQLGNVFQEHEIIQTFW